MSVGNPGCWPRLSAALDLEATSINDKPRAVVAGKQSRLATMMDELVEKSVLYASRLKELD
jgi:hypothetical protein